MPDPKSQYPGQIFDLGRKILHGEDYETLKQENEQLKQQVARLKDEIAGYKQEIMDIKRGRK